MALNFKKIWNGLKLVKKAASTSNSSGDLEVVTIAGKDKLHYYNAGEVPANSPIVTEEHVATLTNKTFDANGTGNTLSNIETADLASGVLVTAISVTNTNSQLPSAKAVYDALGNQNDASEINFTPITNVAGPKVQDAIAQVQSNLQTHIDDATAAHAASAISNIPSGNLTATEVQAALNELQTDVDSRATSSALTSHTGASSGVHGVTGSVVGTSDNQTLTTKIINADNNTISNLEVDNLKAGVLDTDLTSVSVSDDTIPSAKAVKTYADSLVPAFISNQVSFTIANNQSSVANITGLSFNPAVYRSAKVEYVIYRQTDNALTGVAQVGQLRLVYNSQQASWLLSDDYAGQSSGVDFSITTLGQVQYTSSDLGAGTNYVGSLKYSIIKTFGV